MIERDYRIDVSMPADLGRALEAYRAEKRAKKAHAVRALLSLALRQTGHLAPLRRPEDAAHLENVRLFPWSRNAPTDPIPKMVWFSRDPSRLTWATLFESMEHETQTSTADVAARHGISTLHAYRIFRRFDAWRRGSDHRPRLDPFSTPRGGKGPTKSKRRKKTNAKRD